MENDRHRFRVWDNQDKFFISAGIWDGYFWAHISLLPDGFIETLPRDEFWITDDGIKIMLSDRFIVEQCTGLSASKSYRGNKPEDLLIWEGDKVLFNYNGKQPEMVVEWDICNPCFVLNARDGIRMEYDFIKCGDAVVEIIGNVHEEAKA